MALQILAISGSLRRVSLNTTLLHSLVLLAPVHLRITLYEGLGDLPHFNPDREDEDIPAVRDFRDRVQAADGLILSSPEYAHGVPGVLKNALDWIVGSGELIDKPIALFNPSPSSVYAQASLTETLTVMTGRILTDASLTLPLRGSRLDEAGIAAHPEFGPPLRTALAAFAAALLLEREQENPPGSGEHVLAGER
jgi:NAD(P)H-dependent FMN reductase